MSDRLLSRLADRLGLDESETAPILKALLKQVRKRATTSSGVRIPTLGKFTTGDDGTLQFHPDDDLIEAVNEDFSGLEDEPAPSPARPPDTSTALAEAPPKPGASGDRRSSASPETGDETAEDDATEELPAAGSGSLWPGTANGPTPPDSSSESTAEKASSPGDDNSTGPDSDFWSSEREWDLSSVAFGDVYEDTDSSEPESQADAASKHSPDADVPSSPPVADDETRDASGSAVSSDASSESGGSGLRTAFVIALVLAVAVGGWVVLGNQGTIPAPSAVINSLTGDASTEVAVTPSSDDTQANVEPPTTPEPSNGSASESDSPDPGATAPADTSSGSDNASSANAPSTDPPQDAPEVSEVMPSEGGWTLVVASRTSADEAESIRTQFASALESARVPVDVLTSETGDGTTRYRVVVGQFSSQNEAQLIKQEYSDVVPDDAWPLQL